MSARSVYTVMSLLLLSTLWSCRKEVSTENNSGINPGAGSFTAQIDGVTWTAADTAKGASILVGQINLIGVSADNRQLSITLDDTVTGVYALTQSSVSLAAFANNDSSELYAFTSNQGMDTSQAGGIVTVTEIDKANKTISGTFSFKLYRDVDGHQKTVKNGVFNRLPYVNSLPPANGTDTLEAVIDGQAWVAESIVASAISSQLTISGSDLNAAQTIGLIIPINVAPGAYTLDYTALNYIGVYVPGGTQGMASISGNLQILENNSTTRRVRGNFDFLAVSPQDPTGEAHNITKGYFSVQYN